MAAERPRDDPGHPATRPRWPSLAAAGLAAIALALTFSLYLRPGLLLDLGQLMQLCGLR